MVMNVMAWVVLVSLAASACSPLGFGMTTCTISEMGDGRTRCAGAQYRDLSTVGTISRDPTTGGLYWIQCSHGTPRAICISRTIVGDPTLARASALADLGRCQVVPSMTMEQARAAIACARAQGFSVSDVTPRSPSNNP